MKVNFLKKYNLLDLIILPFKVCPFLVLLQIIEKVIFALIPSLTVMITANFINTALSIFDQRKAFAAIHLPLILLVLITAYGYINDVLMSFIRIKMYMRLDETFQLAIFEKKIKLNYIHIENNESLEVINRVCKDPAQQINQGFDTLLKMAGIVIRILSLLAVLISQEWWAGIIMLLISVPLFTISAVTGKKTYEVSKETAKLERKAEYLHGIMSNRESVEERSLFGFTDYMSHTWDHYYEAARKMRIRNRRKGFVQMNSASFLTLFAVVVMIFVLLKPLQEGSISIGLFMAFVTVIFNLMQGVAAELSGAVKEVANKREFLKDLNGFLALNEQEGALDEPKKTAVFESIEFKNVSFTYPGTNHQILKNCSFKLIKNMHYAFVGVNGAGKTTMIKLITGLYQDFSGEILINDRNIKAYSLAELKAMYAVIHQDFAKYYISVKDNIMLGNIHGVSDERIQKEVKRIGLEDVIAQLPDKIDTCLGKVKKNGVDVSGGEWQRIAIARALVSDAPITVLDEPTAALDPTAESSLYHLFGQIMRGKSTIFITHRLGATKLADEILVIDKGKIAEKGTHTFLMKADGIYKKMFAAQGEWYQ